MSTTRFMIGASLLLAAAGQAHAQPSAGAKGADAAAIHSRVLTLDSHADVLVPSVPRRYFLPDGGSRIDVPYLTKGGIDAVVLAVTVGPGPRDAQGVAAARKEADEKLAWIRTFVASNPDHLELALSADDIERIHKGGKTAIVISFQNARSIGSDLTQIDRLYSDGIRVFAFNHIGHNDFSDSARPFNEPVSEHGGLSPIGKQAVRRLNDLGVLIDVTQLSSAALLQTLALTRVPVAATHSDARAIVDNVRNLTDAELDAIKANGGVVQATPFPAYVHRQDQASIDRIAAVRRRYGLTGPGKTPDEGSEGFPEARGDALRHELAEAQTPATLSEYVDQIDYIAKRIGWQHVGIGSDFNQGAGVTGFMSEADAPNVTAELVRRGYTEEQIAAIWGGNFLRVLHAAEAGRTVAASSASPAPTNGRPVKLP